MRFEGATAPYNLGNTNDQAEQVQQLVMGLRDEANIDFERYDPAPNAPHQLLPNRQPMSQALGIRTTEPRNEKTQRQWLAV